MKKTKLIGLSLLAFSAVSVMASCSGGKPASKPDVYFRAQAAVLNNKGESKIVDYKNTECAEMDVKDKANLKYGAQDVVITIKPKKFFTFRKYDEETWEAERLPVHPYVGLGNPHTLYNYPLQENVAWTFKDKSVLKPVKVGEEELDFYDEEYEITVKKEFFQKNIVIDYGNVRGLNNNVYVYNSSFYDNVFNDPKTLIGDFGGLYEIASSVSNFAVASKGATVTYALKENDNLYNFYGWADKPVKKSNATNDDKLDYENFKIWGYPVDGSKKVNIAQYDPAVDEDKQLFKPSIAKEGQMISFDIDWHLLAVEENYDLKFNKIEVEFKAPNVASSVYYDFSKAEGTTRYECDFFQYTNPDNLSEKKPFTGNTLIAVDPTAEKEEDKKLEFANILLNKELSVGESVKFSMLFALPDDENKQNFSVTIGNYSPIEVDINNPQIYTNWHKDTGIKGELELPCWYSGNWYLMQLNPYVVDEEGNPVYRTYGLPEKFQKGQQNLYYLYTKTASEVRGGTSIKVAYEAAPEYVNFSLDNETAQKIGQLTESSKRVKCVGKSEVYLEFTPNTDYKYSNFDVTVTGKEGAFEATYTRGTTQYDNSSIYIHSTDGTTFAKDDSFVITLTETPSAVSLVGQTSKIGQFVVPTEDGNGWQPIGNTRPFTQKEISDKAVNCYFQFYDTYAEAITQKGTLSEDFYSKVSFDGQVLEVVPSVVDSNVILLSLKDITIKPAGSALDIIFNYISFHFIDQTGLNLTNERTSPNLNLGEYVGKKDTINGAFKVTTEKQPEKGHIAYSVECLNADGLTAEAIVVDSTYYTDTLSIAFHFSATNSVTNGMTLNLIAYLGK